MTSVLAEDLARVWPERGAWRRTAELVKTAPSCSGARPEVKRETALRDGKRRDDHHEVSILIQRGYGERPGRGPSNVSTLITGELRAASFKG
jgi:hypothetical protein